MQNVDEIPLILLRSTIIKLLKNLIIIITIITREKNFKKKNNVFYELLVHIFKDNSLEF